MASWSELLSALHAHAQNDPNWLDNFSQEHSHRVHRPRIRHTEPSPKCSPLALGQLGKLSYVSIK